MKLDDIPVVRECPEIFLEKLNSLSIEREIEFKIELKHGMKPIFETSYRMAPTELKEIKIQIRDLLEREFLQLSE